MVSGVAFSDPEGAARPQRRKTPYELLADLSRANALEDLYEAALRSLLDATAADRAAILLFDDDGVIRLKASRGLSDEFLSAVAGHSSGARSRPVVPNILNDDDLKNYRECFQREAISALTSIPLSVENRLIGELILYFSEPHECSGDELDFAQAIAAYVAVAAERRRMELALARTERRLQAILDNSATIIFLKDVGGRYQFVNRRYEELFRIAGAKVLGRTDFDIFPLESAVEFRRNDQAVIASGKPLAIEEHVPRDGVVYTCMGVKFPLEESDGTIGGVGGIATYITDRNQLETAGQHLAAIIESSADAIISKDLNGLITSWNKGAQRIFGYTSDEVLGKPVAMLAAPDRLDEMPDILSRIRKGLQVEHYETRRRRKDGTIIDVALTVSPVRDSAGRIIGASKIARDITDRKLAEQERALLLGREKEARRIAELLNRVGPRLAAQLELETLVQEVTDISTALVGAEFGSFLQRVVGDEGEAYEAHGFSGAPREGIAPFPMPPNADLFGPAFRGERVVRCEDVADDFIPEGPWPVRSYLAAPVIARSGEILGGLFFGHSVPGKFTESHEAIVTGIAAQAAIAIDNARLFEQAQWAQTELKRSNEDLRRANQDLETFAYSASHDLLEPLRTVSISAQLIQRNLGQGPQGDNATFLANILTASNRMIVLVNDLLAYSKATQSEEGAPPPVDSAHALAIVLETLRVKIAEAGAEVTATELPTVFMHETRLCQLFQNLIANAIKYCKQEVPRVHVRADERDGWSVFSVADNGIGIEPQYAERIFGLFKRLHGRDEYEGSGIGLAICQRIVERYGGRIWLERSTPGGGSTFCFAIPSRPQPELARPGVAG